MNATERPTNAQQLRDVIGSIRADWGLDFRGAERVIAGLSPPGATLRQLVQDAAVPRREVEGILRRLEPWLTRSGEQYVLTTPPDTALSRRVARPCLVGKPLVEAMGEISAKLPPAVWRLDHVSAVPTTMAARAEYLAAEYALAGATVLCVGDHDLTSVAVALAEPAVEVLVVDVDQRLLAFIDEVAAERGLPIITAFADVRATMPQSFLERADLVFTDPPYTPEGIGLFLSRALQGLSRTGHERVVFAYGFAGHQLTRGFRTQSVLHELRLVIETVLPGFNRFAGAEAIGATSSLYVCRPTRWTWSALDRSYDGDPRIYTRGASASEAASAQIDEATMATVRRDTADWPSERLLVGDGWPPDTAGSDDIRTSVAEFLAGQYRPAHPPPHGGARQASPGTSAATKRAPARAALINLYPHFGQVLPSVLLASVEHEAVLVLVATRDTRPALAGGSPLMALLRGLVELDVREGAAADRPSMVIVRRRRGLLRADAPEPQGTKSTADRGAQQGGATREPAAAGRAAVDMATPEQELAAFLVTHPHAKLGNTWRDGLLAIAVRRGQPLTKNEARAIVDSAGLPAGARELRLSELPSHRLAQLVEAVPRSLRDLSHRADHLVDRPAGGEQAREPPG